MSVETLGEWLDRWHSERTASAPRNILDLDTSHARARGVLHDLLDAIVIGPCEDCGGDGVVPCHVCGIVGEVRAPLSGDMEVCGQCHGAGEEPCPDCASTPTWVIAPDAWEAFVCVYSGFQGGLRSSVEEQYRANPASPLDFDTWWARQEAGAERAARALLGGEVYVAKEVLPRAHVTQTDGGDVNGQRWLRVSAWRESDMDEVVPDFVAIAVLEDRKESGE